MKFILQLFEDGSSSHEIKNARHHALMEGIPVSNSYIHDLGKHIEKNNIPIGNVQFVKEYCRLANIDLEVPETYPEELSQYLKRNIKKLTLSEVDFESDIFIKPVATKQFTGFCLLSNDAYSLENKNILMSLPTDTQVYISDPINIEQEYRCYFKDSGNLVSVCRYDSNETDDLVFDASIINEMGLLLKKSHPFVLDIGITKDKQIILVEHNDFWAIGMYDGISRKDYINLLIERWRSIERVKDMLQYNNE